MSYRQFGKDETQARKTPRDKQDKKMQSHAGSAAAFFPNCSGLSFYNSAFNSYSGSHTHFHCDTGGHSDLLEMLKQHGVICHSHDAAHCCSLIANLTAKRADGQDPKPLLDGARVISREDISLTKEIYKGRGYRLHSAHISGRAVAVKVYERNNAKERCLEVAKFHKSAMHPRIPQMMGVSSVNSDLAFLVFSGDYEGPIESIIAQALAKDLKQSLILGFQTVADLSSGLDFLESIDYPFASARLADFDTFINRQGNILISFDPEVPHEVKEQNKRHDPLDVSGWGVAIFNGLCQKIFDTARESHYQNQQIQHAYDDHDNLGLTRFEELHEDEQFSAKSKSANGQLPSESSPNLPKQAPLTSGQRRELVWKGPSGKALATLGDISHKFQEVLDRFSLSPGLLLNRRRGRNVAGTVHRCRGYNRIEIMLTTDVTQSAIVSHSTPTPHEICPVCNGVVDNTEKFNCICGGFDNESIPTVRCSACFEWHHQPCVAEFPEPAFVCQRCHQPDEMQDVHSAPDPHPIPDKPDSNTICRVGVSRRNHSRSTALPSVAAGMTTPAEPATMSHHNGTHRYYGTSTSPHLPPHCSGYSSDSNSTVKAFIHSPPNGAATSSASVVSSPVSDASSLTLAPLHRSSISEPLISPIRLYSGLSFLFSARMLQEEDGEIGKASSPPVTFQTQTSEVLPPALSQGPSTPSALPLNVAATVGRSYNPAPPSSPRTTRRQMLATEMSQSLRLNLLRERQLSKVNLAAVRGGGGKNSVPGRLQLPPVVPSVVQLRAKGTLTPEADEDARTKRRRDEMEHEEWKKRSVARTSYRSWGDDYHRTGW